MISDQMQGFMLNLADAPVWRKAAASMSNGACVEVAVVDSGQEG